MINELEKASVDFTETFLAIVSPITDRFRRIVSLP